MSVAFIGNTLLDRSQDFGYLETLLHQAHPNHDLTVRNLAWSADALGFNRVPQTSPTPTSTSFSLRPTLSSQRTVSTSRSPGPDGLVKFQDNLNDYITETKSKAFNGKNGPKLVLLSPIANENTKASVPPFNKRTFGFTPTPCAKSQRSSRSVSLIFIRSPIRRWHHPARPNVQRLPPQ
ncbi:MAG: hypothetical protein Ct9H300mP7_3250 [Verrucomicrobiota bacterium]|nr:MAG: hypothetical protein Ct9H300mP7_3250 [Verrucomicrobiota bacterium]